MTSTGALRNTANMANMATPWFRIFPPEEIAEDPEFIGESGVKNMPDRGAPAIAYFMLMFTVNLMKKIVLETNRNDPTYDPSAKFKPILDSLNMRSKYLYTPERNLSIDESLVGTRARSVMTQYIPSKSHKFGIKLWMLVESISGYLIHSTVYRGRRFDPVPDGELQSSMVVKSLLNVSCLFDKGYHVFCDSFFSSLSLASELLLNRTFMTGTLNPELRPDEYVFMRRQETLVCAYRQNKRKPVRLVSTFCKAGVSPRGKPTAIESYSKNMGGVDRNDMFTAFYNDERKTVKMWKKIMFNLFKDS
ncbi:unnamed protein product [Mytilus edulis]|uniref:PiggyBac transposable element-derived protein domain-containing protein n=1 Tax=Mytilus edulis TaxID=6550 RepID=A0A8S3STV2_MYTED|nr:unnamed protein product [Mytilus edulis]